MIPFTLKQLSYFTGAVEAGSTVAAAEALHISQPSVSMAITRLEAQLGVQLLLRGQGQKLVLTAQGQHFYEGAKKLLSAAEELAGDSLEMSLQVRGHLEVGCFVTAAPLVMPRLIAHFIALHPAVEVSIRELEQSDLLSGLEAGRFPVAILYDEEIPESLVVRTLRPYKPHVLLPANSPLAESEVLSLETLASEPLVLFDIDPSGRYFLELFRRRGLSPKVRFRATSFETVRGLVGSGLGYSLLITQPAGTVTYDGREIMCKSLGDDVPPSSLIIARSSNSKLPKVAKLFWDVCLDYFAAGRCSA
ncbi:MAG: LysR family transcriptional regulator [Hyphomicrobiaceae bacterium]|nr:LysR family transcriptional regulator [Hyphomicrobiaceae bacterium]